MGEVCVGGGDYASLIVIAPHFPKTLVVTVTNRWLALE